MNNQIFNNKFKHRNVNFLKQFIIEEFSGNFVYKNSNFLKEYTKVLKSNRSTISTFEGVNKMRRCYNLIRLLKLTSKLKGTIAECGVYKGTTAKLIYRYCKIFGNNNPILLFDTFTGLPKHSAKDTYKNKRGVSEIRFAQNNYSDVDFARFVRTFKDGQVGVVKGNISETLKFYSNEKFSFVHVDVDLYESTMQALKFFVPRMVKGGILLCDDYLTPMYPGAKKAWDEYFEKHNLSFITLDNYQSAYKK